MKKFACYSFRKKQYRSLLIGELHSDLTSFVGLQPNRSYSLIDYDKLGVGLQPRRVIIDYNLVVLPWEKIASIQLELSSALMVRTKYESTQACLWVRGRVGSPLFKGAFRIASNF